MRVFTFLVAAVLSRIAAAGGVVVFPILALRELDDLSAGAVLVAAALAPTVVFSPLVGAVLDSTRHPRLYLFGAGVVSAGGYATAALLGLVPFGVVVLALVAAGCATPVLMGGLSSFVTGLIAPERTAYATDTLAYSIAGVGGPALCSAIIAIASPRWAALALAAAGLVGAVVMLALRPKAHSHGRSDGLWTRMTQGAVYLVRHRPLLLVTASSTLTQIGAGAFPIAAVVFSLQHWQQAETGGWIVTAFSIGTLVSAVAVAIRPIDKLPPARVMAWGFALTGVLTALSALDVSLAWTIVLVGMSGLFSAPSIAAMFELRTMNSVASVRAQVFTVGSGLRAAAGALGAALIAPFVGIDGAVLLTLVGLIWLASAAIMLPYRTASAAVVAA
ncbi:MULTISPECIES: MFS transporter [unclassified Leifsonia]|uniref:MFS transporter n=1 Tax=unclassified Leifsonia TaxID=2663824 RepID=UPI000A58EEDB|nr:MULTISPECIES: MFS transporter [unclassified Leifsonia]